MIIRPTVIFGRGDVLMNNIAWFLRRVPVFAVPGNGQYQVQPVSVDDVVRMAIELAGADENAVTDAAGPETFAFDELLETIGAAIGQRTRLIHLPKSLAFLLLQPFGFLLRDTVLTRAEIDGLTAELLVSSQPSAGQTSFSQWVKENGPKLGVAYASEVGRHYR